MYVCIYNNNINKGFLCVYVCMKVRISTTIDPYVYDLAKDHDIRLNEALTKGILLLTRQKAHVPEDHIIEEAPTIQQHKIEKLINANTTIQNTLLDRDKELEKLKNAVKLLEKKAVRRN